MSQKKPATYATTWSVAIVMVTMTLCVIALATILAPDPKIVTRTLHDGPVRYLKGAPEPNRDNAGVGLMTRAEFDSIRIHQDMKQVHAMFGDPPGNVTRDGKTFYPAVGGGAYWIHSRNFDTKDRKFSDCTVYGEYRDDHCVNVVTAKDYLAGGTPR